MDFGLAKALKAEAAAADATTANDVTRSSVRFCTSRQRQR